MADRPTYTPPQHIIDFAIQASFNIPCLSRRGAAIFNGENLVSVGWNHQPRGFKCTADDKCKKTCGRDAVHAEQAALIGVGNVRGYEMLHVKTVDGQLVPSMAPSCLQCSKLIIEAGLSGMWLYHEYGWRLYSPVEFHWMSGAQQGLTR